MSQANKQSNSSLDPNSSSARQAGLKLTELGLIPDQWDVVAISELAQVKTGPFGSSLHERDYVDEGTPIITVEHLSEHGITHDNLPLVSDSDKKRLKGYTLRKNDIVFSRVGSVDRNSLVSEAEDGWLFSGRLLRVRASSRSVIPQYLSYHFHSEPFKQRVRGVAVGQTMASLNTQILRRLDVVVAPVGEQRIIATALSDVDGLLEALDTLIAKKQAIKQAAMAELLTGKNRLPGFEKKKGYKQTEIGVLPFDWELDRIDAHASITTGTKNTQDRVADGLYPFFVRSQQVERINSFTFDGEAVLTAGDGVGTGKVFHYINGRFDVHQRVYRITDFSTKLEGRYFFYQFRTRFYGRIMAMTAKSSVDSIRMEMIAGMEIPLPPINEQRAIATVLTDMDAEIEALEKRRQKILSIKQGMMQELLTGRTRLVKPEAAN